MTAGLGFRRALLSRWTTPVGAVLLALVVAMAVSAPIMFDDDPWAMVARPLLWPGDDPAFPLGSDALGRDVAAGIFHGARVSLLIGATAAFAAILLGTAIGAVAGYYGGWADDLLMRLTETFQTVPPFIFTIVIVTLLVPSVTTVVIGIALVSWPTVARLVRAEFLSLRRRDFVSACKAVGMGDARIIVGQILPNALSPIVVTTSIMMATAILTESALAFLGLGDPNVMSWGTMIAAGREMLRSDWYLTALPGLAILVTVLALNLISEGLNDALNPHLRDG